MTRSDDLERRRLEYWSWALAAAVAEYVPITHVIETHAAGGLYDTVELVVGKVDANRAPWNSLRVAINRPGRVHVLPESEFVRDLLGDLMHGLSLSDAADALANALGTQRTEADRTATSLVVMRDLLARAIGADWGEWEWRNGYLDSSMGSSIRAELFDAVPSARVACTRRNDDILDIPEYRFWFLMHDGTARLALDVVAARCFVGGDTFPLGDGGALDRTAAAVLGPQKGSRRGLSESRSEFVPLAWTLAERVVGAVEPYRPKGRLSTKAVWLIAADSLVVVVGRHERVSAMDEVLAYALAHQGNRDLVLIVPTGREAATMKRLPWIDGCVRVFVYGPEHLPRPSIVPSRYEVLETERRRIAELPEAHRIGNRRYSMGSAEALMAPLLAWVRQHDPPIRELELSTYVAWKFNGVQVLRVSRRGDGLRAVAGIDYRGRLPVGRKRAVEQDVSVDSLLDDETLVELQRAIDESIDALQGPEDLSYLEHRLQAALGEDVLAETLGLVAPEREYPVWRSGGGTGYVDFLGFDADGRMHVVETKVDPADVSVMLQGLDYVISAMADEPAIREGNERWRDLPDASKHPEVVIDFICAPKIARHRDGTLAPAQRAVGPYLANQLEVLSPKIGWRIWLVDDPRADRPVPRGPIRSLPYQSEKGDDLIAGAGRPRRWLQEVDHTLRSGGVRVFSSLEAAAVPGAVASFHDVVDRGLAHKWLLSARSSQALALNVFAPLDPTALRSLVAGLGHQVIEIDPVVFEYVDSEDRLGELRPRSPHQTQVDVFLRGVTADKARVAVLIEVKLTEEFGHCSAYDSEGNDQRALCRSSGVFGSEPKQCFQLRNHGEGRRRYDVYLRNRAQEAPDGATDDGGCIVRRQLSQPTRNLALGQLLVEAGEIDRFVYAVCAPAGFESAWRRVDELRAVFPDTERRSIGTLTVEAAVAGHPDGGAAFRSHYRGVF